MRAKDFANLLTSVREARQIKARRRKASRVFEVKPPEIKRVRAGLGVSQGEFALMIGVSRRTLQNWEQGRRRPVGPAKALLRVAARDPASVLAALHDM
jgi:putative transcriptional regulator